MSSSLKQRNPLSSEDSSHASLLRRLVISLIALVWVVLAGMYVLLGLFSIVLLVFEALRGPVEAGKEEKTQADEEWIGQLE